jgi:hypothetical protein
MINYQHVVLQEMQARSEIGQDNRPLILSKGIADGKYARHLLKASAAAQPKGCSARFVPALHPWTEPMRLFLFIQQKTPEPKGPGA